MRSTTDNPWTDTPPLSERVIAAIARISSVLRSGVWEFATSEGLNPTQLEIVEMLSVRRGGVRVSWIANQLGVTTASASDSISSLTAKGLVAKVRGVQDGRTVELALTKSGRDLARRASKARSFASIAVARMPAHSQEQLYVQLLSVVGQLQRSERFPEMRTCIACKHFAPNMNPDSATPDHCRFVNAPLPRALLRLDCQEYEAGEIQQRHGNLSAIGLR